MKNSIFGTIFGFCLLAFVVSFTGCAILNDSTSSTNTVAIEPAPSTDILQVGDRVKITFSGLPIEQQMLPQENQINESGDISLPLIGTIKAAGKSVSQLQQDIQKAYVPRFYRNLNVSVGTERFYYVGGEVKHSGRLPYLGGITVMKAIQSAEDFTDFADRKHVRLTRSNGKIEIVNCKKALHDPKLDLPVYPGDTITVPRGF
ncbi:MAG: Polysaccharide biosynthesis/export protein [Verrucomicrobiales bacterium]|nr:Polysaccharide biosynthesis/export protein [Verrucomicrobiales bacterium]